MRGPSSIGWQSAEIIHNQNRKKNGERAYIPAHGNIVRPISCENSKVLKKIIFLYYKNEWKWKILLLISRRSINGNIEFERMWNDEK